MAERKVLNKYYPPDFNPAKIPRRRRQPNNQQINVRMMLPMSIRCNRCGNYMYKGTKFNSNKEKVIGETYLGIHIYRFYFKCTNCCSEITMKTDPQNSDYVAESGASRNFEPWRTEADADKQRRDADQEIRGDAMKSPEKRTVDSKREIDNLAALDEIKSIKSRHATVSVDAMLQALQRRSVVAVEAEEDKLVQEDEEAVIGSIFQGSQEYVKRICDDKDLAESRVENGESSNNICKKRKVSEKSTFTFKTSTVKVSVKRKQPQLVSDDNKDENNTQSIGLQSLCQQYDSSDE